MLSTAVTVVRPVVAGAKVRVAKPFWLSRSVADTLAVGELW